MLIVSIGVGKYGIGIVEGLQMIWDCITGGYDNSIRQIVVYDQRLPRGLAAIIVGAALAVAGSVMQSMLQNPLADPYTTGVSSGASFGAAIFVVLGISVVPISGTTGLVSNAFVMSLVPVGVILLLSVFKRVTATTMILVGIGVMYMFTACTQMLKLYATPQQMEMLYLWQLGSLSEVGLAEVGAILIVCLACCSILYSYRADLNLLSVGDKPAVSMGTNPWKTRVICLLVVSFMTSVVVSYTGVIGFVGLVAPQMIRIFLGSDNRYLIPASAAFGGFFLIACDCIGRVVGSTGVPVGVVTAIIGSPLFLYLLIKRSRRTTVRAGIDLDRVRHSCRNRHGGLPTGHGASCALRSRSPGPQPTLICSNGSDLPVGDEHVLLAERDPVGHRRPLQPSGVALVDDLLQGIL